MPQFSFYFFFILEGLFHSFASFLFNVDLLLLVFSAMSK